MSNITATNRKSCAQLMREQNAELQLVENPNTGKIFFVCGEIKGYVSPAVLSKMNSVTVADLQYAEVSIDNKPAVPCLMMVGDGSKNVRRTLSL